MYRASDVLNQLQAMDDDWVVDLHDAVAVYRDYNGKLRVDQSYQMTTSEGAGWGGLWGSLIGLTLAIPFTGGATAPAAAPSPRVLQLGARLELGQVRWLHPGGRTSSVSLMGRAQQTLNTQQCRISIA